MLLRKVSRLFFPLVIMALLAVSCGAEATIDAGTDAVTADASDRRSDATEPTAAPAASAPEPTAVPPAAEPEPTADSAAAASAAADAAEDAAAAVEGVAEASGDDDDIVTLDGRDDALAFIISEGFIASDAACIVDGAYQVFGTWDFAELDTNAEQDAQLETLLDDCITVVPGPAAGSPPPGSDSELDVLWVACDGGSATACDDLYWDAPIDSDYESFGLTCGGRAIAECSELLGDDSGESGSAEIDSPAAGSPAPGTDADLDALWNSCNDGSATACDDLFWQAPLDSVYEAYGLSCGGRTDGGFCSDILDG